jgi:hypothetical protein
MDVYTDAQQTTGDDCDGGNSQSNTDNMLLEGCSLRDSGAAQKHACICLCMLIIMFWF